MKIVGDKMLYKKNKEKVLSKELFKNPTSEFRGTPFWAWNDYLTKEELSRQIEVFNEMGLGGFHMHVRTGLKNQYLSEEYMGLVKHCVEKAKEEKMLAWLYDEDRWPSGAAGGLVTKDEKYLEAAKKIFSYIENVLTDKRPGSEWFWAVSKDGKPDTHGITEPWKCPYHNGRMCLELISRGFDK